MCGIAGKVYFDNKEVVASDIKRMTDAISHRGPDDEGFYISQNKKVGLGNRRLSIIDLSKKGHMPMNFLNKYQITYNGEIYNFWQERKRLEKHGYKFRSKTDTEVILALYDKYGINCLEHLRGMFAFAIYDKEKNIIFLARDRMGKKPLKYYLKNGEFIFSSELKSILSQKEVKKELDYQAIYHYLTFGYVPSPMTGFVGISKLEPGHYLIYNIEKNTLKKEMYWKPDFSVKEKYSFSKWKSLVREELEASVKLRMIADVPIGVFLSGGVDSSILVYLMSLNSRKSVKTFTIGFKENRYDERKYAITISKLFNTDHQDIIVNPNDLDLLPQLSYIYEEPFANSSSIISYLVSKKAKEYVKVALNGDGGDEAFAGYDRYNRIRRDVFIDHFEKFIRPWGIKFSETLSRKHLAATFWKRIEKYLLKSLLPLSAQFASYFEYFNEEEKKLMLHKTIQVMRMDNSYKLIEDAFVKSGTIDPRDEALYWDLTHYLPEELLVKVDIASMANGLEARSPYIDHKFIELTCKIPFGFKVHGKTNKFLLKKAFEDVIPKEILYRKKMGFSIPLKEWFCGDLAKYTKSALLQKKSFVKTIIDEVEIKKMLSQHCTSCDFGPKLWNLLSLELWHKSFF